MLTLKLDGDTIDYQCDGDGPQRRAELPDSYDGPGQDDDGSRLRRYYRDAGYLSWSERDNPCSDAYYRYNDRAESSRAFLASNLGLIAKQGESDRLTVIATHLDDNTPATKVRVTVHNYQHQVLASGTTNVSSRMSRSSAPSLPITPQSGSLMISSSLRNGLRPLMCFDIFLRRRSKSSDPFSITDMSRSDHSVAAHPSRVSRCSLNRS